MRLVAVTMVRNEADVIEAFVRHAAALVDHHIIFDHQSTDGTAMLLARLAAEGLPLTLLTDDRVELMQNYRTAVMFRKAVHEFNADWVLPLDSDEFPQAASPAAFRETLAKHTEPLQYWMTDYAPHPDDSAEPNPVLRLTHRTAEKPSILKVIVPRDLAADPSVLPEAGNHRLFRDGSTVVTTVHDEALWLAHFPTRSVAQTVVKVVQHELQRICGGHPPGGGTHYRQHFLRLAQSPRSFLADPGAYLRGTVEAPAAYWGGPLRYSLPLSDWERIATCLVPFVEKITTSFSVARREVETLRKPSRRIMQRAWRRLTGRRAATPQTSESVFADGFREGLTLLNSRTASTLGCELEVTHVDHLADGIHVRLQARNTGLGLWHRHQPDVIGTVNLGVQRWSASGECLELDYQRHPLPRDVYPDEVVHFDLKLPHPNPDVCLRFDMVSEGVSWFGIVGCQLRPLTKLKSAA